MTTERQIVANRQNAKKSTGPRSAAGKVRSSRNAYRHGLSVPSGNIEPFAQDVLELARALSPSLDHASAAYNAAEAQIDLLRAQNAVATRINKVSDLTELSQFAADLLGLERYERRASSRRNKALREIEDD
jgi:hypothetical protein